MKREINKIAKKVLLIDSLETRNSDHLDFHDLHVSRIREALEKAYEAGQLNVIKKVNKFHEKLKIILEILFKK